MKRITMMLTISTILLIGSSTCAIGAAAPPASQPSPAQPRAVRPGPPMQRMNDLLDELNLSDQQRQEIDEILDRARAKMQELREDFEQSNLMPMERRQRIHDAMKIFHDEIADKLDEAQRKIFGQRIEQWQNSAPTSRPFGPGGGGGFGAGRPGGPGGPGGAPGAWPGAMIVQRIENALRQLQLSDEQQTQIRAILGQTRERLEQIRNEAQSAEQQARQQFRQLMQETRDKLSDVLTEEQRDQLRELLPGPGRAGGGGGGGPGAMRGRGRGGGGGPPADGAGPRRGGPRATPPADDSANPPASDDQPDPSAPNQTRGTDPPPALSAGDAAPEFSLRKLDGLSIQLSSFQGRVLVLVFGSYSSPSFRDHAPQIDALRRQFGARADFLVIYAREAHAKDEWEVQRNADDDIEVAQPAGDAERRSVAEKARDRLRLSTPIAIDDMNDTTASAYGAGENSAYIINRDGTIAYRQNWCDPGSLERKLDEILKSQPQDSP